MKKVKATLSKENNFSSKQGISRNLNLDLIRILAVCSVLSVHFFFEYWLLFSSGNW